MWVLFLDASHITSLVIDTHDKEESQKNVFCHGSQIYFRQLTDECQKIIAKRVAAGSSLFLLALGVKGQGTKPGVHRLRGRHIECDESWKSTRSVIFIFPVTMNQSFAPILWFDDWGYVPAICCGVCYSILDCCVCECIAGTQPSLRWLQQPNILYTEQPCRRPQSMEEEANTPSKHAQNVPWSARVKRWSPSGCEALQPAKKSRKGGSSVVDGEEDSN